MFKVYKQIAARLLRRWAEALAPSPFNVRIEMPFTINGHEVQPFRIDRRIGLDEIAGRRYFAKFSREDRNKILKQETLTRLVDELAPYLVVFERGHEVRVMGEFYFRKLNEDTNV